MKKLKSFPLKCISLSLLLVLNLSIANLFSQLPFYDGFESGSFSTENWTVTGSSEISTEFPYEGSYCVKGPGTYSIEQIFNPITDNIVTIEYAMKASQTGSVCVNQRVMDDNGKMSGFVAFRWNGNIVAKNGPEYDSIMDLQPYIKDVWYEIKVELNVSAKTYDVFIDGVLKADNFDFYDYDFTNPSLFKWNSGETWGIGWLDCIQITADNVSINDYSYSPKKLLSTQTQ